MLRREKEIRASLSISNTRVGGIPCGSNMLLRTRMLLHSGDILNAFVNRPVPHPHPFTRRPFLFLPSFVPSFFGVRFSFSIVSKERIDLASIILL